MHNKLLMADWTIWRGKSVDGGKKKEIILWIFELFLQYCKYGKICN